MTIPATTRKAGPYSGTGAQTTWPFTFKVFAAGDIAVTIADSLGVETVLTLGSHYSVTLNSNQETSPGGTVTYPLSGSPLPIGSRLTIAGDLDYDQPLDIPGAGNFSPAALENQLDRIVMQVQQVRENLARALQTPITAPINTVLPTPAPFEVLGWDAAGTALVNVDPEDFLTIAGSSSFTTQTFSGTGAQTAFVIAQNPGVIANLEVFIGGVRQMPTTDYTISGTTLTFTSAPPVGTHNILVRWGQTLPVNQNVTIEQGGTGATTAAGGRKNLGSRFLRLEDYGGGVGVTDNTPALNALVADMAAQVIRIVKLDTGIYNFTTKPAAFTKEVIFVGEGMSNTVLARNYSEAGGNDVGFLNWHGSACNGGGLRDLMVLARNGTTGGTLVKFSTGAADPAGYHKLENVVMTYEGTGAYHRCLLVDGSLNTTPGSQGLRDFHAVHVWMFARNLADETARFLNAVAFSAIGIWTSGVVTVFGGGTATSNSTQGRLDIESLANVFVGNSKLIAVNGTVDTLIFSTGSEQCHFSGVIQVIAGGFSDSGTNNLVHTLEPWQTYTPTVTSATGSITSATATGRYIKRGRRVDVQIRLTITNNGTGGTAVNASLPFNSANIAGTGRTLAGREETSTGYMLQGFITPNSGGVQIYNYDNTYPGATGRTLHVNGTYEVD